MRFDVLIVLFLDLCFVLSASSAVKVVAQWRLLLLHGVGA